MTDAHDEATKAPKKVMSLHDLQRRIEKLDEWNGGLWLALSRVTEALCKAAPDQMAAILESWSDVERRYDRACRGDRKALTHGETLENLEPRALLVRTLSQLGLTPQSLRAAADEKPATARRARAPGLPARSPARSVAATTKRGGAKK